MCLFQMLYFAGKDQSGPTTSTGIKLSKEEEALFDDDDDDLDDEELDGLEAKLTEAKV